MSPLDHTVQNRLCFPPVSQSTSNIMSPLDHTVQNRLCFPPVSQSTSGL